MESLSLDQTFDALKTPRMKYVRLDSGSLPSSFRRRFPLAGPLIIRRFPIPPSSAENWRAVVLLDLRQFRIPGSQPGICLSEEMTLMQGQTVLFPPLPESTNNDWTPSMPFQAPPSSRSERILPDQSGRGHAHTLLSYRPHAAARPGFLSDRLFYLVFLADLPVVFTDSFAHRQTVHRPVNHADRRLESICIRRSDNAD